MNIAVIFAGGSGTRMNSGSKPKQFLELQGKPILVYTLELFDSHPEIDAICVSCIEPWIPYLNSLLERFHISKVVSVVPGGATGQDSIYNGLIAAREYALSKGCVEDAFVLVHDGVRPLINHDTISDNIRCAKENGNCVTCIPATETFIVDNHDGTVTIPERNASFIARAPQTFKLVDILASHEAAIQQGKHDYIDSCTLMSSFGHKIHRINGPVENIKITTPTDFYLFRTFVEVRENQQIFGMI